MKLIIAPHADDETLGCGGLMARCPDDVMVVVLSDKGDGRMDEFHAARKILGYSRFELPTFETGTLLANARAVTSLLDSIVRLVKPTGLYLPVPGAHQDHQAAYECGIRAARKSYTDNSWFVPSVMLYEVPSYTADLYVTPYRWSRFISLNEEQLDKKKRAIDAYGSQAMGSFDPGVLAVQHARYIGAQVNLPAAEQYAVVRETID
jgi:LmbE family N-acetylglucosaminyl deacetylase